MAFGGRMTGTPLKDRLVARLSGMPTARPSPGPGKTARKEQMGVPLGADWPRLPDTEPMPMPGAWHPDVVRLLSASGRPLASEAQRRVNRESIAAIPARLLMCPGKRGILWALADDGEEVYAERPNFVHPSDWYLHLWGVWARLVPCDYPPDAGDYSGNVEDYRPRPLALSGIPRPRVPTGRFVRH